MLEAIRKNVTGILAKILIALLILSFAVWGIGDMVTSYGRDAVGSVGGTPIKTNDFRQAYQLQLDGIARQFGRRLTPQQAKAFGIEQQVLARLTGAAAVDNHGRELNLDISDRAVEKSVYTDPLFQGVDGTFSRDRLEQVLRQSGYTEKNFFESRKRDVIRSQLTDSILANVTPPKALTEMLRTYQGEERVVEHIEVEPAKAVSLGEPTAADLEKAYDSNKRRFVVPEYRKFQALLLTSAVAKAKLEIPDVELKTVYEADKSAFAIPEQRRIQQIAFQDEEAAKAAKAKLAAGSTFLDVAIETGAKEADINLGLLTKEALIDPAVAEAAFKLTQDEVSDPIKGRFTTVLLRITEIQAGKQRPFEEVKGEIREQIEIERFAAKIQEIQNSIDDNRLAGKSLKEISETLQLPFVDVAETDRQGNTSEGKPSLSLAEQEQLVSTAFAAEVGVENEVISLPDDGLAWLNLIAVVPEKQKAMQDVMADVKKVWTEIETERQLRETTAKLATRINEGTPLATIAAELDTTVKTTPAFKRGDSIQDFPAPAISRAFALQKAQAADAAGITPDKRIVFTVVNIIPVKPATDAESTALSEQIAQQLQADIVAQYVSDLQKRMAVSLNQTAIDQATGAAAITPN